MGFHYTIKRRSYGDPRVFFAAERTLLAWIRTGLTVMTMGFVVARFGLFLTLLGSASPAMRHGSASHLLSHVVGIVLVLLGTIIVLAATWNHKAYVRQLPPADIPQSPIPGLPIFFSLAIAAAGAILVIYLAFP